jgi:hypothetical protein
MCIFPEESYILLYLPISTFFIIYYEIYIDLKYFVQNVQLEFLGT